MYVQKQIVYYAQTHSHTYVTCTHPLSHLHTHIHKFTHMHIHTCTNAHMHKLTYTYTHTHTHAGHVQVCCLRLDIKQNGGCYQNIGINHLFFCQIKMYNCK